MNTFLCGAEDKKYMQLHFPPSTLHRDGDKSQLKILISQQFLCVRPDSAPSCAGENYWFCIPLSPGPALACPGPVRLGQTLRDSGFATHHFFATARLCRGRCGGADLAGSVCLIWHHKDIEDRHHSIVRHQGRVKKNLFFCEHPVDT